MANTAQRIKLTAICANSFIYSILIKNTSLTVKAANGYIMCMEDDLTET